MQKMKLQKMVIVRLASKILHELEGYLYNSIVLQAIKNSREFLLHRNIVLKKTQPFGAPHKLFTKESKVCSSQGVRHADWSQFIAQSDTCKNNVTTF